MRKKGIMVTAAVIMFFLLPYLIIGNPIIFFHNQKVKKAVISIDDGKEIITLNEVIPFIWDTVYTFPPYTSKEEIEEMIGFKSRSIEETISEGMVQLLFVKDNSVTASICGYSDNLGYRVDFFGSVTYEEKAEFSIKKDAGIVILTKQY